MTSYRIGLDSRRRKIGRFIGTVRRELQRAFLEEKAASGLTQNRLAQTLGVNRSLVTRQLHGRANLTLETVADYAWAMGRDLVFKMPGRELKKGSNHAEQPVPAATQPGNQASQPFPNFTSQANQPFPSYVEA